MLENKDLVMKELALEIISEAQTIHSSDIHILPEGIHYFVYLRMHQSLIPIQTLSFEDGQRLIAYFKYLGDMDVGEQRRPQSGSVTIETDEWQQNLRFSTMTNYQSSESLVIRLLNPMTDFDLVSHTFFPKTIKKMEQMVAYNSGMILFSGPVGSGKTTTMYQLVRKEAASQQKSVITIEDPVEIEEENFLQIQVNERAGITYESLLKQSLRHHPDIVIVGEIRDEETADAVIRGSLSGHLIIATIHAKNAEGVIDRLFELGISHTLLSQVLVGVVFQKMLPVFCPKCQKNAALSCKHLLPSRKKSVLFDIRHSSEIKEMLAGKKNIKPNFNTWLRKALEDGNINQTTFDQYIIP